MRRSALLGSSAIALVLLAVPASAQMQQKGLEGAPQQQTPPAATEKQPQGKQQAPGQQGKAAQRSSEPQEKASKGSAQKSDDRKPSKATAAQKGDEGKAPKDAAQAPAKDTGKGSAQAEPKAGTRSGSGETTRPKSSEGTQGTTPKKDSAAGTPGADRNASRTSGSRVQLSEQQRTNFHQTILKEKGVNRVSRVNFSISVGTRIPRTVRLVVLPATVLSFAPEYRSYRYFVVDDQICVVDPNTYEIVDVIIEPGRVATRSGSRTATLVLTEDERQVIRREIDLGGGGSTMALGSLSEGADVPRGVQLRAFPAPVAQMVPKVRLHQFFTAEDRIVITDPDGRKVLAVIDARR